MVFSSHKPLFFFINIIYIIFMAQTIDKDVIYLCTLLLYKIYYQLPSCIPHRFLLHRLLTECGEIREINVQVQERLINDLTCSIQNQTYHFWTIFCCWKWTIQEEIFLPKKVKKYLFYLLSRIISSSFLLIISLFSW